MDKPLTILFICTGNTCRSCMAEALAKAKFKEAGWEEEKIKIFSAGVNAWDGCPASPQAVRVMKDVGIDLTCHRSRQVTPELVEEAEWIFTMTASHKRYLLDIFPQAGDKVFAWDIEDPFGGSDEIYRRCAGELKEKINWVMEEMIGEESL